MQIPETVVRREEAFGDFHRALQSELDNIARAWANVVDVAAQAQSAEEINAAETVFIRTHGELADSLAAAWFWHVKYDEIRAALSQPLDCGILNQIRLRWCTANQRTAGGAPAPCAPSQDITVSR